MARLTSEVKEVVKLNGEEVILTLRRPTNAEISDFFAKRYKPTGKQGVKDDSYAARIDLFDRLLMGVENLEDAEGKPITAERKEIIPAIWKYVVIFKNFEEGSVNIQI
ncbi:MAG TPA: hypothetical protein DD725_04365 [Deltaproteobacteria bacterium]|nr:hypothetical protein [Deltaproteobacteria bacterium]